MQLDANGNVIKLTYPDSYYVERVYDELNRLTEIKLNGSATPEATISYDILSRRANVEFANGTSSEYEFSLNNDMTGLAHSFVGSSANFAYGFNDAHQLTSQNVSDDQFVWHPASAGTVTYAAANDLNQYPTVGGVSYTYNNNGCLTGDGVWTFGYDVLNRFISAVKSGVSASYLYDPMDRQSQKNVGGTKTRFIYNGLQRIAEYDGTAGTLNTRFVYATGLDEPIVEVSSGGTKTFFHRDRLGSIIARTNNSGAVTQRYEYGPYGESAALSGTSFGFTGQRYDAESGLYNYKARYYSPVIGRFLQPDVIGYADGLNLYTYVYNQPVNFSDPLGLASDSNDDISGTLLAGDPVKMKTEQTYDPGTGRIYDDEGHIVNPNFSPDVFSSGQDTDFLDRNPNWTEQQGQAVDDVRRDFTHDVVKGDTLWDISRKELGDANRWGEIYNMNKTQIGSDPRLIYPGQHLNLPIPGSSLIGP
jgi:RHS repeat-associated protein